MSTRSRWSTPAADALRVDPGFRLADIDTRSTPGYDGDKTDGRADLEAGREPLEGLQERLFAQSVAGTATGSVLLVLQAMDTAGKGGIVRHVVGAVDPQGVELASFKKPTAEELEHDFLWRIEKRLPDAGRIGVFDRSHYEDVLVHRVHELVDEAELERRYEAINAWEKGLVEEGTLVLKCFLHISADTQRERLLARLDDPDKQWKFKPGDVDERQHWGDYQRAYETALERCSTDAAPWYVVPADRKWYRNWAVARLLLDALRGMELAWPEPDYDVAEQRARLEAEADA